MPKKSMMLAIVGSSEGRYSKYSLAWDWFSGFKRAAEPLVAGLASGVAAASSVLAFLGASASSDSSSLRFNGAASEASADSPLVASASTTFSSGVGIEESVVVSAMSCDLWALAAFSGFCTCAILMSSSFSRMAMKKPPVSCKCG